MYLKSSIESYLNHLASDAPVPGGGGTSALAGALGISLILMVGRIVLKKQKGDDAKKLTDTLTKLEQVFKDTSAVVDLDPKVFQEVMASYDNQRSAKDKSQARERVESALANAYRLHIG